LYFINELAPDLKIIIPHCGLLNGGFERFSRSGIWERPNIFTDTALAPSRTIAEYVKNYGHTRIMFGSDFPFGDPVQEYRKIMALELDAAEKAAILMGNILALLSNVNGPAGDGISTSQRM
jgi:predicted TIM-barrel fold metal-dependent hydrolase